VDLPVACVLFAVEAVAFLWRMFAYGMDAWAAGPSANTDGITLAEISWAQNFALAVFVIAVLALLARMPWTAAGGVAAALAALVLLTPAQHRYDLNHPTPQPAPSIAYTPCYSGSGTCN
jgi:hypothetical protein